MIVGHNVYNCQYLLIYWEDFEKGHMVRIKMSSFRTVRLLLFLSVSCFARVSSIFLAELITGWRIFFSSVSFPSFSINTTLAIFQISGKQPISKALFIISSFFQICFDWYFHNFGVKPILPWCFISTSPYLWLEQLLHPELGYVLTFSHSLVFFAFGE